MRSGNPPRCLDYLESHSHVWMKLTVPKIFFMATVRPHFEYGNVIWHPRFELDKAEIEKVQSPYEARNRSLKLSSLDYRRRRFSRY